MKKIIDTATGLDIDIQAGYVCSIVIENPRAMYSFVCDIYAQCSGESGKVVLSENYEPMDLKKTTELITQLVPFSINKKELLNKIYAQLNSLAFKDEFYQSTQEMLSYSERYLYKLTESFSNLFAMKHPDDISWLVKGFGLGYDETGLTLSEKLFEYMLAVSEYLKKDIFIIVGLRSYLTDKQAYGLYKSALLSGITLICVDDRISTLLDCEKRTIIDDDMCII